MSTTAIPVDIYLKSVLERLEQHYHVMADALGPPELITQGRESWLRYPKQSDSLLCLLKGVKLVSTLNAALVLLHHGHFHEVAALCRMADDFILEILFMRRTLNGDKRSQAQEQFFSDFFQEEFEDIEDPLGTSKARNTVPRKKISAAFSQIVSGGLNPSDAQNVATITHRTLSGYIHGSYVHILELHDGKRFHMSGMPGTLQEDYWRQMLIGSVYQGIIASECISRKIGPREVESHIQTLRAEYEAKLDYLPPDLDPEALIRTMKK